MARFIAIIALLGVAGCRVSRQMKLCRVSDERSLEPIGRGEGHMRPFAPLHPFWPRGDAGVTDANGEVRLSLPNDFWWYFSGARAAGYSEVKHPAREVPPDGAFAVFYMQRVKTADTAWSP